VRRRGAVGLALAGLLAGATGRAAESLPVEEVASGVFVHRGLHEDFSAANEGGIANLAFVIGRDGVAVIDSGGSPAQGRALSAAVRAVSARPVRFVINTHDHPDHVLGNPAFRGPDVTFIGHAGLPDAMATRGPAFVANMKGLLGPAAQDIEIVPPTLLVTPGTVRRLDLGDRQLVLQAWPPAHTGTDLTVLDPATGTLFTGDLLFMERLPVVDGSLTGWLTVMEQLARVEASRVIPGHGPSQAPWPAALDGQRAYLTGLRDQVRQALADGLKLAQTVEAIPPPGTEWQLSDPNHQRNVTAAYTELEWE
jgi:quinoprotein relay system zinc metallohydrolase 2